MSELLSDPAITALNVVTTPEEMPVHETIELVGRVRETLSVPLGAVVVNRVLPELFGRGEEEVFERLRTPGCVAALGRAAGGPAELVLDAAELAVTMRRTRAGHLARLREELPPDLPLLYVPYLFARSHGVRATTQVAEALGAELGY
jgi:anion-transporting  ArsA/GET3 family ATPase